MMGRRGRGARRRGSRSTRVLRGMVAGGGVRGGEVGKRECEWEGADEKSSLRFEGGVWGGF